MVDKRREDERKPADGALALDRQDISVSYCEACTLTLVLLSFLLDLICFSLPTF